MTFHHLVNKAIVEVHVMQWNLSPYFSFLLGVDLVRLIVEGRLPGIKPSRIKVVLHKSFLWPSVHSFVGFSAIPKAQVVWEPSTRVSKLESSPLARLVHHFLQLAGYHVPLCMEFLKPAYLHYYQPWRKEPSTGGPFISLCLCTAAVFSITALRICNYCEAPFSLQFK